MTSTLKLRIYGEPVPQGSVKAIPSNGPGGRPRIVNNSSKVKPWRAKIVAAYKLTGEGWQVGEGVPVTVSCVFWLSRPSYHYKAHGRSAQLRDNAPARPVASSRNDWDKLARSVCDGLADAGVYPNDSQVVDGHVRKLYATEAEAPGALILVEVSRD